MKQGTADFHIRSALIQTAVRPAALFRSEPLFEVSLAQTRTNPAGPDLRANLTSIVLGSHWLVPN